VNENACDLSESESADLKRIFYAQAHEIAEELQDVLMRIEAGPGEDVELKVLKRFLHTLKGDANSLGYTALGHLCHRLEDLLVSFADQPEERRRIATALLFMGVDEIKRLLAESEAGSEPAGAEGLFRQIDLLLHAAAAAPPPRPAPALTEYQELQLQDAREHGQHLFELAVQFHPECGEKGVAAHLLVARLAPLAQVIRAVPDLGEEPGDGAETLHLLLATWLDAAELRREALVAGITTAAAVSPWDEPADNRLAAAVPPEAAPDRSGAGEAPKSEMLRVDAGKVDRVLDLVGELIIGRSMLDQLTREAAGGTTPEDLAARLLAVNSYLERTVTDLHKGVRKMRMVPVRSLFRKFPRMIRDLANQRGKIVRLDVHGEETELDKAVVDALGEPLTHIIRNLVDHGLEAPEARRAAGKPESGTVTLRAYHEAAQIVIEAADDGRGLDTAKLRSKAVELGLLGAAEAQQLSDADAGRLLFLSGVSTAAAVSETSGRGVGMAAVKTAVEAMKGTVEIQSAPGRGASFRLRLPITLAVIKSQLFEAGPRLYAIPVSAIVEVARVSADELQTIDGRPVLLWRGGVLSLVDVRALFGIAGAAGQKRFVLILNLGGRRVGLLIDRLLWQQELVVKALDDRYLHSDLVAGASILGDGKVVLILDAAALVAKAIAVEKGQRVAP
jgi:two-component system chemotaxis sensor kinase CheA